jgi:hypothetical protein
MLCSMPSLHTSFGPVRVDVPIIGPDHLCFLPGFDVAECEKHRLYVVFCQHTAFSAKFHN